MAAYLDAALSAVADYIKRDCDLGDMPCSQELLDDAAAALREAARRALVEDGHEAGEREVEEATGVWEGWDESMVSAVDEQIEEHRSEWASRVDGLMTACWLEGQAKVGDVVVTPDSEFIPGRPSDRQVRGWPASRAWYVTVSAPDGCEEVCRQGEVSSWGGVLAEALRAQEDYDGRRRRAKRSVRDRRIEAEKRVRLAEDALKEAQEGLAGALGATGGLDGLDGLRSCRSLIADLEVRKERAVMERDAMIRAIRPSDRTGVAEICSAAGISRPRYYQIRQAGA
ncbi:hypothetical protein [Bifidobacterium xylocopae]|uniref:Uncharacterized protein n=1 Tax=Bifidobacterium xylocopae TaxID=2493119 RepID=A0A366KAX3_9BIFI|nr:hypothetical protein [Bifidobacterium xylocopae]RBP98749.1 hypothetical protein CRD59_07375 [Bifidobacterium xylocopae]